MAHYIFDVHRKGNLTLQTFDDPEDPCISAFKMKRKEVLYQSTRLLSIDIFEDLDDYSIFWRGSVRYDTFLNAAIEIQQVVSTKAEMVGISVLEKFTGHIFLPSISREEELTFPFNMLYFDDLVRNGMTFLRLDMPYVDVWADLTPLPGQPPRLGGETGLTSIYNIAEQIVTFYLETTGLARNVPFYTSDLEQLLSTALANFRGL